MPVDQVDVVAAEPRVEDEGPQHLGLGLGSGLGLELRLGSEVGLGLELELGSGLGLGLGLGLGSKTKVHGTASALEVGVPSGPVSCTAGGRVSGDGKQRTLFKGSAPAPA